MRTPKRMLGPSSCQLWNGSKSSRVGNSGHTGCEGGTKASSSRPLKKRLPKDPRSKEICKGHAIHWPVNRNSAQSNHQNMRSHVCTYVCMYVRTYVSRYLYNLYIYISRERHVFVYSHVSMYMTDYTLEAGLGPSSAKFPSFRFTDGDAQFTAMRFSASTRRMTVSLGLGCPGILHKRPQDGRSSAFFLPLPASQTEAWLPSASSAVGDVLWKKLFWHATGN